MQSSMKTVKLFETHAHYDDEAFDSDRERLLPAIREAGIERIVNVAAGMKSVESTLALTEKYPYVYGVLGVHPSECGDLTQEDLVRLEALCKTPKCLAVGEIGLDYYWPEPDREIQKKWFTEQLAMAKRLKLPVVIHSRDAAKDTMDILQACNGGENGGVIHCFSYSKEQALAYVKMGFYIGVGGVVTFKNGVKLKEAVSAVPLEKIVLETDSPYLAPVPNRGKRNDSRNLLFVAEEIARLKGVTPEETARITWENACRLYKMDKNPV